MKGVTSIPMLIAACCIAWSANGADKVVMQLRWDHQFQFAGYYAAQWRGYYADAGLEVELRSGFQPDGDIRNVTEAVAAGEADFGTGAADILVSWLFWPRSSSAVRSRSMPSWRPGSNRPQT